MSHKLSKKIRRKLRDENVHAVVEKSSDSPKNPPLEKRLLMRRKDQSSSGLGREFRGGAILHPMCERAMYQFAKKRGVV